MFVFPSGVNYLRYQILWRLKLEFSGVVGRARIMRLFLNFVYFCITTDSLFYEPGARWQYSDCTGRRVWYSDSGRGRKCFSSPNRPDLLWGPTTGSRLRPPSPICQRDYEEVDLNRWSSHMPSGWGYWQLYCTSCFLHYICVRLLFVFSYVFLYR